KKVILHLMSLTKAKDPRSSHFGDAKNFRAYMRKESYRAQMHVEAALIIQRLEVEGPKLPEGFDEFFKLNLKSHVPHAYDSLLDNMKNASDQDKVLDLDCSTRRLIYRWFIECKYEGKLHQMPDATMEWIAMAKNNICVLELFEIME
ncbi:hypothetical protein L7F22_032303, partial [Adiantum nelumboides]|nr:hypothetical protein [Adiantum nelumboides]